MDLNRLYFDHQLTLMRVARSASCDVRRDHVLRASTIAGRIGSAQRALGARAASTWEYLALPIATTVKPAYLSAADGGCDTAIGDGA